MATTRKKAPRRSTVQMYVGEKGGNEFREKTLVAFQKRLKGRGSSLSSWFREAVEAEMDKSKEQLVFEAETMPHMEAMLEGIGYTFCEWVRWSATKALVADKEAKRVAAAREKRPLRDMPAASSFEDLSLPG